MKLIFTRESAYKLEDFASHDDPAIVGAQGGQKANELISWPMHTVQ